MWLPSRELGYGELIDCIITVDRKAEASYHILLSYPIREVIRCLLLSSDIYLKIVISISIGPSVSVNKLPLPVGMVLILSSLLL